MEDRRQVEVETVDRPQTHHHVERRDGPEGRQRLQVALVRVPELAGVVGRVARPNGDVVEDHVLVGPAEGRVAEPGADRLGHVDRHQPARRAPSSMISSLLLAGMTYSEMSLISSTWALISSAVGFEPAPANHPWLVPMKMRP